MKPLHCSPQALFLLLLVVLCAACGRLGFELRVVESAYEPESGVPSEHLPGDADGAGAPASGLDGGTVPVVADGGSDAGPSKGETQDAGGPSSMADPFAESLIHHYAFNGTGTLVADALGSAHATVVGTTLDGVGGVVLSGGVSGPHVALPAGLISSLESLSVEAWLTWNGGTGYQRVFDFGNNTNGAGAQGDGTRFFSLAVSGDWDVLRLVFDIDSTTGGTGWRSVFSSPAITSLEVHQLVAVFDRVQNEIRLYVDGGLRGSAAVPVDEGLSDVDDINNWFGMAQWTIDPNLAGTLHDVRLYDVPLSDADVIRRFQLGYE